jgi:formate dehydrogenase iron-sulfur subunit
MGLQTLDLKQRSATTTPSPQAKSNVTEVAKLIDVSKCIGCKACQVACSEWNDLKEEIGFNHGTYDNPRDLTEDSWTVMRFSEVEMKEGEDARLEWLIRKDGCMHCADPGCLKACPAPGAILQYANGIVDFNQESCIGCGNCITGCPFNVPRISKKDSKAYKCSLCSDRVSVGLEPACVKTCPTGAISFGSKGDMTDLAADRVTDLVERGYKTAGLYDPKGVGGTHVMYVLKHADQPMLYAGLPADPSVAFSVELWKGGLKPLALLGMGAAMLGGLLHYLKVGPNDADAEEKEKEAS